MKQQVKLNEAQLRRVVAESVNMVLKEFNTRFSDDDYAIFKGDRYDGPGRVLANNCKNGNLNPQQNNAQMEEIKEPNRKDSCLHMNDIENIVNQKIAQTSKQEWIYIMKYAVRQQIESYWEEELNNSKHMSQGRGYAYVGDAHGISNHPDVNAVERQTQEVLNGIMLK